MLIQMTVKPHYLNCFVVNNHSYKLLTLPNTGAPAPKKANGTSELLSFGVKAVSVFDAWY